MKTQFEKHSWDLKSYVENIKIHKHWFHNNYLFHNSVLILINYLCREGMLRLALVSI